MKLHHVGIAVQDMERALAPFRMLGLQESERGTMDNLAISMVQAGESRLEFLQPLGQGPVQRFLERRGAGIHHLAFATPDIEAALDRLKQQGAELIDKRPHRGFGGHLVAFIHPRSFAGLLVELVEVKQEGGSAIESETEAET